MNLKAKQRVLSLVLAIALVFSNFMGLGEGGFAFAATGAENDPYTVAEALQKQGDTGKTVQGYIVGVPTGDKAVQFENFTSDSAIAIADSKDERDTSKMLYVQVTPGFQSTIGLKTNIGNLGAFIKVTGSLEAYFKPHAGLKSPSKMAIVPVGVTGVKLDKSITSVAVGGAVTLNATVEPATAANRRVVWSSSDDTKASVSENGIVTGVAEGEVTITATTEDGNKTATCKVIVRPAGTLSIAEARTRARTEEVTVTGIVTWKDGNNYYIQDESAGLVVFKSGLALQSGDKVVAKGKVDIYNGLFEIKPDAVADVTVKSSGNQLPESKVVTVAQANSEEFESQLVTIRGAFIGTLNTTGNTLLRDSSGEVNIYKIPAGITGLKVLEKVDITGIVSQFNNFQLRVRSASDVVKSAEAAEDTQKPVINHTQVILAKVGEDLTVTTGVNDNSSSVLVKLYYRKTGVAEYTSVYMLKANNQYSAIIPKAAIDLVGLEYYIEAYDGVNTSTLPADSTSPFSVPVSDNDLQGPVISSYSPLRGASTEDVLRPVIEARYSDEKSGVDVDTVKLYLDGNDVTSDSIKNETGITYTPQADLARGNHNVRLIVKDKAMPTAQETVLEWNFYVGKIEYNFYYGQLHAHTNYSDGQGTPEQAYSWAKNEGDADFFAVTDHSNSLDGDTDKDEAGKYKNENITRVSDSTSTEWKNLHSIADSYNRDGEFVAIAGFEMTWSGSTGGWGHINTFNTEWFASRNNSSMNLKAYYDKIGKDLGSISQLNHPGKTFGDFADFGYYTQAADNVVKLVEVGNGEGAVRSGGYFPSYEYYTRALDKGWHVAPSNNQDNHRANWVSANTARTVAIAPSLTRESIYEAFRDLRVYSTEDSNLQIMYKANGVMMGSSLNNPETLSIEINVSDPDSTDKIKKVSIISNGGQVVASKEFDSNIANWNLTIDPENTFYYVRVDQEDTDIAVTSPVWTAEVTPVGVSKVEVSQNPQIVNNPVDITATLYNNGASDLSNVKVEFYKNSIKAENKIGEKSLEKVGPASMEPVKLTWTPTEKGEYKIYAQMVVSIGGSNRTFGESTSIDVADEGDVVKVVIDGGHYNQYVTGSYSGKITALREMLAAKKYMLIVNNNELTADDLKNANILIITDPQSKDDTKYNLSKSNFTDDEIQVIKDFTSRGGSLIITSRADYDDKSVTDEAYESANQGNRILEAIGANLRFNDDEVIDKVSHGGDEEFRLYFDKYTSTKFNLTKNIPDDYTYSAFSGCSVVLKDNGDATNVDWLVKGHDTTEILDSDLQNDAKPVTKGDVKSLAAEILPSGSKIIVAGTTFFSDFEVTGDNIYSNRMITESVMRWFTLPELKTIAEVRKDADNDGKPDNLGKKFMVEGRVTAASKGAVKNTYFFDVIYVQDETAGITVFGLATKAIPLGTRVRLVGVVDQYDGDAELQLLDENLDLDIVDNTVKLVEPKFMTTAESMLESNEGLLVKVEGKVTRITENALYVNDGSGESRVYVNGYIGNDTDDPNMYGKWDSSIKPGDIVSAIGLASEDPEGHRIRVRNTSEIVRIPQPTDNLEEDIENAIKTGGNIVSITVPPTEKKKIEVSIPVELLDKAAKNNVDINVVDGRYKVTIPSDAIDLSRFNADGKAVAIEFSREELDAAATEEVLKNKDKSMDLVGRALEFNLTVTSEDGSQVAVHNFNGKVKVVIYLTQDDIKGVDTTRLAAYYFNPETKKWEMVDRGTFNKKAMTFTFETNHFSTFAIMENTTLLPKTGESSNWFTPAALTLILAGAFLALRRRRNE